MLGAMVKEYLFNEKNKEEIIKELNKHVDIPFINEKTEAKIINAVYSVFEEVLGKVLSK
jgi:hypothetical protein|tara:strand:- start:10328 stop:10504 length:177 start_codon:yes stop_codon:yes gene_type:complete